MEVFMKKYKIFIFILLTVQFIISGCTPPQPQNFSIAIKQKSKEIVLAKNDFDKKLISNDEIKMKIEELIVNGGMFVGKTKSSTGAQTGSFATIYNYFGVDSKILSGRIDLVYFNGTYVPSHSWHSKSIGKTVHEKESINVSKITTSFPYEIKEDADYYKVTVAFPSEIKTEPKLFQKLYSTVEKIQNDIDEKFNNLENFKIEKTYKVEGEIDSKYSQASIYSNFRRNFKSVTVSNSDEVEKKSSFFYEYKNKDLKGHVNIYPYRDGSKVKYEVLFPYEVTAKYTISNEDVAQVKDKLEKVIND